MINTAPVYLIVNDHLRNLPPDKSLCSDSFYTETDHESKLLQSGKMDDTQGGLCLASLLASHPGLRPVTINLDPPFFVPPGPYISKYLDPPALIFLKYMDPHACYQL